VSTPGDDVPEEDHDRPEPPARPDPDGVIWANPSTAPFEGPPPPGHRPPPYPGGFDPYHPAFRPLEGPDADRPVRRSRTGLRIVAAIVGIAMILVVVITASTPGLAPAGPADLARSTFPPGATGIGGGIALTSAGKAPAMPAQGGNVLDVYEDYQCPYCGEFEASYGDVMQELDRSGKARVVVHLVTTLDASLGNDASARAALAASCAAAGGRFQQFHETVYDNQPDQEGQGWSDDELAGFARTAGLDGDAFDDWRRCVERRTYADYLRQVGAAAATAGVSGTPAFFLNGRAVDLRNVPPEKLLDAFGGDDI
jgi:protein-disulfide isomerase